MISPRGNRIQYQSTRRIVLIDYQDRTIRCIRQALILMSSTRTILLLAPLVSNTAHHHAAHVKYIFIESFQIHLFFLTIQKYSIFYSNRGGRGSCIQELGCVRYEKSDYKIFLHFCNNLFCYDQNCANEITVV